MQQKNYFRIHDIIIKVFSYKQLYKTINFNKIEVCGKSIKLLSASPQLCSDDNSYQDDSVMHITEKFTTQPQNDSMTHSWRNHLNQM